jgi:hypothetical protein
VTSHDGTYTYDDASRLIEIVEDASGSPVTESYSWYDDRLLKSYPGPGYERLLDYSEEGQMTKITKDFGGSQTLAFEYMYGFDGGVRWEKDYAGNDWNWYPCGVACRSGELAILTNTIGGSTWSPEIQVLSTGTVPASVSGITPLRTLTSPRWMALAVSSGASVQAQPNLDYFGVDRNNTDLYFLLAVGVAALLLAGCAPHGREDMPKNARERDIAEETCRGYTRAECDAIHSGWIGKLNARFQGCLASCGIPLAAIGVCAAACFAPEPALTKAGCLICLGVAAILCGGCISACVDRYFSDRDKADAWYQRCLRKAKG